ncbi:MAG: peptidoglycan-binding protein [Alicyclobacillus herbarius]|uniref:peptidoglycan-binding protein n=1 Tax=Alicyclobacillus herbarius TaxID=122960 RepID=UPI002354E3B1|nr:peptidoglycan-binding protein [Alicyclobacillus herbarius]MCL6633310.1 peptidoglycan-binding protein [Alicyclobacillus herbarius]
MNRRLFMAIWTAAGLFGSAGVAAVTPTTAYASSSQATLRMGAHGASVSDLQRKLNSLGYACGKVDGVFGLKTLAAVKKFQEAHHLIVDGIVGPKTWTVLDGTKGSSHSTPVSHSSRTSSKSSSKAPANRSSGTSASVKIASTPTLRTGSSGASVKTLQTALNQLGFACGKADGVFGSRTASAVRAFQKKHHLTADGIVGSKTWAALKAALKSADTPASRGGSPPTKVTQPNTAPSKPQKPSGSSGSSGTGKSSGSSNQVMLQYNDKGPLVKQAQQQLIKLGYLPSNGADGDFGPQTLAAVKAFQQANHLGVDGVIGPQTWGVLFSGHAVKASKPTNPAPKPTQKTRYVLYSSDQNGNLVSQSFTDRTSADAAYDTLNAQAVRNHTEGGYVVDLATKAIVDMPKRYYFEQDGQWYAYVNGYTYWEASKAPSWAKSGALYYATDGAHSLHHYADYYLLSDHTSQQGSVRIYSGQQMGTWESPFRTVDLRSNASVTAGQIDNWLKTRGYALQGLGSSMLDAQKGYGVNAIYLMAHAVEESAGGRSSIALAKNNIYGYGAYDSDPGNLAGVFPSEDYAIHYQAYTVRLSYLESPTITGLSSSHYISPNLDGMNQSYASDHDWSPNIAAIVDDFTTDEHVHFAANTNVPSASFVKEQGEPEYVFSGARAQWAVTNLNRTLQQGISGNDVRVLQALLMMQHYDVGGTGSQGTDGVFGPATAGALQKFQQNYNKNHDSVQLRTDGICDAATWKALMSPYSTVNVQAMRIGFAGGQVTDELKVNGYWIDARALHLLNVYRVVPTVNPSDTKDYANLANIGNGLHAGDWVVATSQTSSQVQYCVQQYNSSAKSNQAVTKQTTINSHYKLVPYDSSPSTW